MDTEKPENEGPNPGTIPAGETQNRDRAKKLADIHNWLVEFLKPANVVVLLLFVATLALYLATRDLVADTRLNSQKQLRAYIAIFPNDSVDNFVEGQKAHVSALIQNDGQTPAYDGQWSAGINVSSNPSDIIAYPYPTCRLIMRQRDEAL